MCNKHSAALLFSLVIAPLVLAVAQTGKLEAVGPLSDSQAPDAVRRVLRPQGQRIALDDGSLTAEIWLRASLGARAKNEAAGALYPQLGESTLVGVILLSTAASDYRGQSIKPGTYTLRYAFLPNDGEHLGVAPNPDFLLLIPAASDADPDALYKFQALVRLSSQATGTTHPGVLSMVQPRNQPGIAKDEEGHWIYSAEFTVGSSQVPFSLVVKGTAPQ